jgi:hypothetical protein
LHEGGSLPLAPSAIWPGERFRHLDCVVARSLRRPTDHHMTKVASGPSGAIVSYTAPSASDEGGETPAVSCAPASGSVFPIGTTTVTCTATDRDDANSPVGATFTVTVLPPSPPPQPPVHMFGLRISPGKLSLSGRKVKGRYVTQTAKNRSKPSCRLAIKLKLTYKLNWADTVTLTFARTTSGRKVAGKCVKPTAHNHKRKRCTRRLPIRGKITLHGKASVNRFTFKGTLARHRLGPGRYELTATATGARPQHITFTLTR